MGTSPFAEPEPEPEPSSRARFGGSFSRRFFDGRTRTPATARPQAPPVITAASVKPADTLLEAEQPKIQQRSLALPLEDFPVNNIIFADPPPPPPPPPPSSNIWNV